MNQADHHTMQETTRLLIHTPASWQRLVSVIRHQAAPGHFIFIEGPHASGKSTFAQILQKKLTLVDDVEAKYLKLHPLMGIQQILSEVPEQSDVLPIIILDDANEVEAAVIEELISSNVNCFLVVLAEPELIDRVPRLQNSRFNLPLFNKEDCHKLLSKMYHAIDPSIDIPTLESELVYYESKGFPGKVIELGEKLNAKLKRNTSGNLGFDLANKGIFSTLVIGLGLVIFLLYLFLSDSKQPDKELIQEEQELTELPIQAENKAEEMISGELIITEPEVIKPATFETWLLQQDPDDFTIQLFSNVAKQQAESFQKELDLADSYVYSAEIDGQMLYRVVWGVYPNRARAQLAIQSLPEKILKQKPWLRSFSAISKEIAVQP